MRRFFPVRVGPRPDKPVSGLRPFSQEWIQAPPEERIASQRRAISLPEWLPSDRALSAILVILLVLVTVVAGGGPAMKSSADEAARTASGGTSVAAGILETATAGPAGAGDGSVAAAPSPTAAARAAASTSEATQPAAGGQAAASTPGVTVTDERALLPKYRILAYYGHPADANMGILGEYGMDDLYQQLMDEVAAYEKADPSRPVMPAFELIASVAQNWPADDGTYLLHTDPETIQQYVDFTREKGMLLILDLQIGHSTVKAELDRVAEWLKQPHVQVALDPEFSLPDDVIPGDAIGSLDAAQIGVAQRYLANIARENDLPPKVLMVHRFTENMIANADELTPVAGVQTVIDFDGYGVPENKIAGYNLFLVDQAYAEFAAIKLFYQQDDPMMTPDDVVALDRPPDVVIYQ